jgi:hypothetical protein
MRNTDEPWIAGFLRRLTLFGATLFLVVAALWTVFAAAVAIGLAVTVEGWSGLERVFLGIGVFLAIDALGAVALWSFIALWKALFWVLTGERLAAR